MPINKQINKYHQKTNNKQIKIFQDIRKVPKCTGKLIKKKPQITQLKIVERTYIYKSWNCQKFFEKMFNFTHNKINRIRGILKYLSPIRLEKNSVDNAQCCKSSEIGPFITLVSSVTINQCLDLAITIDVLNVLSLKPSNSISKLEFRPRYDQESMLR